MILQKYIFLFSIIFIKNIISEKIITEAEDGKLNSKLSIFSNTNGYSGKGYVGKFENDDDILCVTMIAPSKGFYNISISYLASMGTKTNEIVINNIDSIEYEFQENSHFEEEHIGSYFLNQGENTIEFRKLWGWMFVDYFAIEKVPDEIMKLDFSKLDKNLTNPNATSSAIKLYNFLLGNYGKRIISGQTGKAGEFGNEDINQEIDHIYKLTGKKPALWNTDFIFKSKDVRDSFSTDDYILNGLSWWEKYNGKGIMSIQWHWNVKGLNDDVYSFYAKNTTFNIEQAVIENTWEYNKIVADINYIASLLKKLQDVNMPVIFRPLHENDGDWFWWGGLKHSKACAKLWKLLYKKLVNEHKINNLIWLWNGKIDKNTPKEYIDLVGVDIYSNVHGIFRNQYLKYFEFFDFKKMIVLSENGKIPNIDKCVEQDVWWGYFMTWNLEYILTEEYNENDFIKNVYNNKYVITMDDLPSFNVMNTNSNSNNNIQDSNNNNNNEDNKNKTTIEFNSDEINSFVIKNPNIFSIILSLILTTKYFLI
ncbi:hypothetical protein BCR36DRAFT_402158 [Piromyces finnis]|uniref:GH26 domain-containing protein n=1 Tax=Piromyces finnis TaxID=1754191 RepID=A0A1Y1VK43_9FUNG|nr:hypothetical protein BCR36DRAFT_402158 [Piromyces finnis]|eukprot:ORX57727.1 hypothetical protein BCR36DRAFT_402158 [Piromyces finnis]